MSSPWRRVKLPQSNTADPEDEAGAEDGAAAEDDIGAADGEAVQPTTKSGRTTPTRRIMTVGRGLAAGGSPADT
jgi:hypothetical protein